MSGIGLERVTAYAGRRALITGARGQDAWHLAEYLGGLGYEVHGLARATSAGAEPSAQFTKTWTGDVCDFARLFEVFVAVCPHEVYHLAAQSHVGRSFEDPFGTMRTNIDGTMNVLRAAVGQKTFVLDAPRVYFAATSEMFGNAASAPQNETSPMLPRSPYAVSKVAGYHLVRLAREAERLVACSGIAFNHESSRRPEQFVTQKIVKAAVAISAGWQKRLELGDLTAFRDWGHAADYVRAMHLMLQQEAPQDFVIATGKAYSVADFCEVAFRRVGIADWRPFVKSGTPGLVRPAEVYMLRGDPSAIEHALGWKATTAFEALVNEMVDAEYAALAQRKPR